MKFLHHPDEVGMAFLIKHTKILSFNDVKQFSKGCTVNGKVPVIIQARSKP